MAGDFMKEAEANGYDMTKVQSVIDKFMQPGFGGQAWFRNIKQVNNVLNSIDLSLSGFHILGTGINASVSKSAIGLNQLLTGHPIQAAGSFIRTPTAALEYVFRGNKIMSDAKAGNMSQDIANITGAGGRVEPQLTYKGSGFSDAIKSTIDDFNNGNAVSAAVKTPLRIFSATMNTLAKPIMEFWVPRIKNGALADLIESNLKNAPKDATPEMLREIKATASDSIDNRFGQLVQDNLFWKKSLKDLLGLVMRSPGWNIGTVRELGLGSRDLFDFGRLISGKGVSDRAAYTVMLPIITGIMGATYQYLHSGKKPESPLDYFYPRTGQVDPKTGKEERVAFPTYMKDVFAFFKDPIQTAMNKTSPILSDALEQAKGVDYFGKQFFDPNASVGTQTKQRIAHEVVKHVPFSVSSGVKRLNPTNETNIESVMGINKAPASITGGFYDSKAQQDKALSPEQKKIADYINTPSSMGGATSAEKAPILLKKGNEWLIPYMQTNALATNPNDPLWSRSQSDIKTYYAYLGSTDPAVKAKLRLQNPWITPLQSQISANAQQGASAAATTAQDKQNSLSGKLGNFLGVYTPQPTNPYTPTVSTGPNPKSQLTDSQRQVVDAYTATPKGSLARKQLLNQNPWLKTYWDQNTAFYNANPITSSDPVANYLSSVGINPNSMNTSSFGSGSIPGLHKPTLSHSIRRSRAPRVKMGKTSFKSPKTPKLSSNTYKVPRSMTKIRVARSKSGVKLPKFKA